MQFPVYIIYDSSSAQAQVFFQGVIDFLTAGDYLYSNPISNFIHVRNDQDNFEELENKVASLSTTGKVNVYIIRAQKDSFLQEIWQHFAQ